MTESDLQQIIGLVVTKTIEALEDKKLIAPKSDEKTAYQKTEALLYNYRGFKKIVAERMQEIENLRKYGVPKTSKDITKYCGNAGGTVQGTVLEEDAVEAAVRNVERSVEGTVQALALIDRCMATLRSDPYYCILEMRYFEGRTQEDIAVDLKCSQVTISKNKARLVKELAMRLFPNQYMDEIMN